VTHIVRIVFAAGIACLPALSAVAADKPKPPTFAEQFEIAFGAGAEWTTFSTIAPLGQSSAGTGFEPRNVLDGPALTGTLAVAEGHLLYRPAGPVLGADAIRLDIGWRGGATAGDFYFNNGSSTVQVALPMVDGAVPFGTAAQHIQLNSHIEQAQQSLAIRPALVFEQDGVAFRLGAGYRSIHQAETIHMVDVNPVNLELESDGTLDTRAFGIVAGADTRTPVAPGLALVGGVEATLEHGRTDYNGSSDLVVFSLPFDATASDTASSLMAGLAARGGIEWSSHSGFAFALTGHVAWQSGLARVVYPQVQYQPDGQFVFIGPGPIATDGPAHIGFESRMSAGLKGEVRFEF
jgi:hypothetical protein